MKIRNIAVSILLMVSLGLAASLTAGEQSAERRPTKEKWSEVKLEAKVAAVDLATREVTFAGEEGNLVTLEVNPAVKRLDEVKVGDTMVVTYRTMMRAEFRDPTPEELANPLVALAEGGKAGMDEAPGAGLGAIIKAVVTVELINKDFSLVTIKGPRGKYMTLPVEDKSLLDDLEIGEVVVMTYAEAAAITLDKAGEPATE